MRCAIIREKRKIQMSVKKPVWLAHHAVPAYNEARESFNGHYRKLAAVTHAMGAFSFATWCGFGAYAIPVKWLEAVGASPERAANTHALAGMMVGAGLVIMAPFLVAGFVEFSRRNKALARGVKVAGPFLEASGNTLLVAQDERQDPFLRFVAIDTAKDPQVERVQITRALFANALKVAEKENEDKDKQAGALARKRKAAM